MSSEQSEDAQWAEVISQWEQRSIKLQKQLEAMEKLYYESESENTNKLGKIGALETQLAQEIVKHLSANKQLEEIFAGIRKAGLSVDAYGTIRYPSKGTIGKPFVLKVDGCNHLFTQIKDKSICVLCKKEE